MASWETTGDRTAGGSKPTLFLDRDGVLIEDRDYLADPAGVAVLPGVAAAMKRARQAGFQLVGVSNQSGIGRGYFEVEQFDAVMTELAARLKRAGAGWDGFFYCPHAPDAGCDCRKPRPGLLQEAAAVFRWLPEMSWVVGDKASDVELGLAAGLGAVLVRTGYGREQEEKVLRMWPAAERLLVADDLSAAVDAILARPEFADRGTES